MDGQVKAAWWAEMRAKVKPTIVPLVTAAPGVPLYCVHSISGAGGAEFGHLAEGLSLPFHAFQVPTAERNHETGKSLITMAANYCDKLIPYHSTLYGEAAPFHLGGWSAGAIVALEMAQQLTRLGRPPAVLIAIDKAPRHTRAEIGPWNSTLRNTYLWLKRSWRNSDTIGQALRSLAAKTLRIATQHNIYGDADGTYASQAVIDRMTKDAKSRDEAEFIAAFYHEVIDYVPAPYPGRVLVLMTADGHRDRVGEGWREIAAQVKVVRVPGSHASVVLGRKTGGRLDLGDVRTLARTLHRELTPTGQVPRAAAVPWRPVPSPS